ncbi:hypothetical protein IG631_08652 [Alternaria alternata]|nr:hypothetical protein IG631_08652 [Alternaria alternata]
MPLQKRVRYAHVQFYANGSPHQLPTRRVANAQRPRALVQPGPRMITNAGVRYRAPCVKRQQIHLAMTGYKR